MKERKEALEIWFSNPHLGNFGLPKIETAPALAVAENHPPYTKLAGGLIMVFVEITQAT